MQVITSMCPEDHHRHMARQLQGDQAAGRRAYVVVPEQYSLQSEAQLLDILDREASIDIAVRSLGALSREVLGRVGGAHRPYLNDAGRRMMLKRVIQGEGQNLQLLGSAANRRGATERILETLGELRREDISAESLKEHAQGFSEQPLTLHNMTDTALLLQHYEGVVDAHYLDGEGRLRLLAEKIPEAHWLREVRFYFTAYYSMSVLEVAILQALNQLGASLTLYLLLPEAEVRAKDPHNLTFETSRRFLERLRLYIPDLQVQEIPHNEDILGELDILGRQLFSPEAVMPFEKSPHKVQVWRAVSTEQEVTYAAVYLRRLVMEEGLRYRDFNIAVTQDGEYLPLIRRIFRHHEIPVFIDARRNIMENPVMRMILNALRMAGEEMPRDAVLAFLQSGMVPVAAEDVMAFQGHIDSWHVLGRRMLEARYFSPDQLTVQYSQRSFQLQKERMEAAGRVSDCLAELFADLYPLARKKNSIRAFARALYHFISQPLMEKGLHAFQETCKEEEEGEENRQVFAVLAEMLDQMVETLGEDQVTFEVFTEILRAGLEETTIGVIPAARDQVQVGTLSRMRTAVTDYQLVLGLSDVWMPSQPKDRGVFSEQEKSALAELGLIFPSFGERLTEQEMLSFYETILRPRKGLIISYPLSDSSQGGMHASAVIRRSLEVFPGLEEVSVLESLTQGRLYAPPLAMREAMASLRTLRRIGSATEGKEEELALARGVYRYYQEQGGVQGSFLRAGYFYSNRRPPLPIELVQKLYLRPARGRISITQLEAMRTCPYRHFVQYGLRPDDERQFVVDFRDFGKILHESLDRLTRDICADEALLEEEESQVEGRMDTYLAEAAKVHLETRRLDEKRNQAILRKVRRDVRRAGRHIVRQLSVGQFRPQGQEVAFGQEEMLPSLELKVGERTFHLEGRIDRVDSCALPEGLYLTVVDYKTGEMELDLSKLLDGLSVQLILYLEAALGMDPKAKPAGLFYLSTAKPFIDIDKLKKKDLEEAMIREMLLNGIVVDNALVQNALDPGGAEGESLVVYFAGKKRDNALSEETLHALMAHVKSRCEDSLADMLQGDIAVHPYVLGTASPCRYCEYHGLCRMRDGLGENLERVVPKVPWANLSDHLGEEASND